MRNKEGRARNLEIFLEAYVDSRKLGSAEIDNDAEQRPFRYWMNKGNVRKELERVTEGLGHFPTWSELKKLGEHALIQGIRNYHSSLLSFRDQMGYEPPKAKPAGYWQNEDNFRREVGLVVKELGRFPTLSDLEEDHKGMIMAITKYYGGISNVRKMFGAKSESQGDIARRKLIEKIEEMVGMPAKEYLVREYEDKHRTVKSMWKELGIAERTLSQLMKYYGIQIRSLSETKLPKGFKKPTKKELRQWYVKEGLSAEDIGEELGVSGPTVNRWLDEFKIEKRSNSEAHLSEGARKPTKKQLGMDYNDVRLSYQNIADKYGVSIPTVKVWAEEYNLPEKKRQWRGLSPDYQMPTKGDLEQLFLVQGHPIKDIADIIELSKDQTIELLDEYGIRERKKMKPVDKLNPGKRALKKMYVAERRSPKSIGDEIGVSAPTVKRWLMGCGISIRDCSEARLAPGARVPTKKELKQWYAKEEQTTTEIGEKLGISATAVGTYLKKYGIETRDDRGIYDDKNFRKKTADEILRKSGKEPRELSTADFSKFGSGILNWYRRNHDCTQCDARDILLRDLYGLRKGSSIFSSRARETPSEQLRDWDSYTKLIHKMFKENPQLEGRLPSCNWMEDHGYSALSRGAFEFHGGMNAVRRKLGQALIRRPNGYYENFGNVVREYGEIIRANPELEGRLPTQSWLATHGYHSLSLGVLRYHGGYKGCKEKLITKLGLAKGKRGVGGNAA